MKKAIAISIIITLAITGVVWYLNSQIKYIDREGVYLHNYRGIGNLKIEDHQTFKIDQQILPSRNDLTSIFVTLKIIKSISLNFVIIDTDNNIIRQKIIIADELLGHIQFVTWDFEPIADSQNQTYNFTITGQTEDSSLIFYTVSPDKYDGGTLVVNGANNNKARIIVDWQYPAKNIWSTLIKRLTYIKPGLFNHAATYIILLILSAVILLFMLFKIAELFL